MAEHDWAQLAESLLRELHLRMDAMQRQQERLTEMAWRAEGMPVTAVERHEGDEGWNDMQDDGGMRDEAQMLQALARQMEQMMHQREARQERSQHQEMA